MPVLLNKRGARGEPEHWTEFFVCSWAGLTTPMNFFQGKAQACIWGEFFPATPPRRHHGELDPPTLTCVLMPHTGVNKTPTCRSMAFRAAEQTLDCFRHFKWRKRKAGKDTCSPPPRWFCHGKGTSRMTKDDQGEDGVGVLRKWHVLGSVDVKQSVSLRERDQTLCFIIFASVDIAFAI